MDSKAFVNPNYSSPDYSTKFFRGYYNFLSRHYSRDIFFDICTELGMPSDYLLTDGNWVSDEFLDQFVKLLKEKTNNDHIAENVGEAFLHPDNINPFEDALLRLMPPELFFWVFSFSAKKVNRRIHYIIKKFGFGKIVLKLENQMSDKHSFDICLNMIGTLKGIRTFYQLDKYKVTHDNCVHRGDRECTFSVHYSSFSYWKRFAIKLAVIAFGIVIMMYGLRFWANKASDPLALIHILGVITFIFASGFLFTYKKVFNVLKHHLIHYEQNEAKERVLHESRLKLDRRYKEANLLRDLSMRLIQEKSSKNIIDLCLKELISRFNYRRAMVMLVNSEQNRLQAISIEGFEAYTEILYKLSVKYPAEKDSPQLFANILEEGETRLISDIDAFKKDLTPENQILLTALGVKSLVVSPIQDQSYKYGILVIGSVSNELALNKDDEHLLQNITSVLSLFFQNARSFEKERSLKSIFQKYVPAVVIENLGHLVSGKESMLVPKNNAVTSMFIDLRSFTKMSETLAPERVVEMLNIYIDHTTDIIAQHGGIIDNLVGDGIVSFFPAIEEHRTLHAKQALICAIDILGKLDELNKKLKEKGFPSAKLGIGLHSGNATVGNVGGRVRVNYTAIGDTVNVAARLEGLCKDFSARTTSAADGLIVLSDAVLKRAPLKREPISAGEVQIRGREDSMGIHLIDIAMAKNLCGIDSNELFKAAKKKKKISIDLDGERRIFKNKSKKKKAA